MINMSRGCDVWLMALLDTTLITTFLLNPSLPSCLHLQICGYTIPIRPYSIKCILLSLRRQLTPQLLHSSLQPSLPRHHHPCHHLSFRTPPPAIFESHIIQLTEKIPSHNFFKHEPLYRDRKEYKKVQRKKRQQQSYSTWRGCPCSYTTTKYLLNRDKRTEKWKTPPHPPLPPFEARWKMKWYHVVWKHDHGICIGKWKNRSNLRYYYKIKGTQEWNTQFGERMLIAYRVSS